MEPSEPSVIWRYCESPSSSYPSSSPLFCRDRSCSSLSSLLFSISISLYLSPSLSLSLCFYLSISVSLSISISISLYIYLYLSISLSIYLSISLYIYLSLSIYIPISLTLYRSVFSLDFSVFCSLCVFCWMSLKGKVCWMWSCSSAAYLPVHAASDSSDSVTVLRC